MMRWQQAVAMSGDIRRDAVEGLVDLLGDTDPFVRWEGGVALAKTAARLRRRARLGLSVWRRHPAEFTFEELLASMRQGLRAAEPRRRAGTVDALGLWNREGTVALVLPALRDEAPLVRASAAGALGKIWEGSSVGAVASALGDPCVWVRRAAADALGAIAVPGAAAPLIKALSDPRPLVRRAAACALGHIGTAKARKALVRSAYDDDPVVRWHAARGLARIGNVSSLPALRHLVEDETRLFGRSTAEVAGSAIMAVENREKGVWNFLCKTFYAIRHRLGAKH